MRYLSISLFCEGSCNTIFLDMADKNLSSAETPSTKCQALLQMRFAKVFPLTSLGLLANLCLPFASSDVLFLMQISHDFHFVVACFGLGAVTGTNRSADLHVRLEIRFSKAALPRAAPRCAQHRITLITGYSENLFSLLQKIQKYNFSRKKEL